MPLSPRDNAAIAKVTVGGRLEGTAFFVAPGLAITAGHAVDAPGKIELTVPERAPTVAAIEHRSSAFDWALLSCPALSAITPVEFAGFEHFWGDDRWYSRGYGGRYGDDGGPLSGTLYSSDPLELKCTEVKTKSQGKGFSGGPLVVYGCVIGCISFMRVNAKGTLKFGFFGAVRSEDMVADWPAKLAARRPDLTTRLPFELQLQSHLFGVVDNPATFELIAKPLGLQGVFRRETVARLLARELVRRPWNDVCEAINAIRSHVTAPLHDLVDALWVERDAAAALAPMMVPPSAGAALRTSESLSVAHHLQRAHAEHKHDVEPSWGKRRRHLVVADRSSGEDLVELVIKAISSELGVGAEKVDQKIEAVAPPIIVAIDAPLVLDSELAAVRARFPTVRLIWFSATSTDEVVARSAPSLQLIKPVPDTQVEQAALERVACRARGG